MSVSPAKCGSLAASFAAALMLACVARAQDAARAPVSLLPNTAPASVGDPSAAPAGSEAPADGEAQPAVPAIAVGALAAPSIDRIGLIDAASGGFSADMWHGTDLELLRRLLPQLPRRMDSLAQRRLARSFLLSAAAPPMASAPAAPQVIGSDTPPPPAAPPSQWLLEARLIGLAAIGDWEDALALIDIVPPDQMTEGLRKLRADGFLVTGQINEACGEAQSALDVSGDAYWQKLQIFCNYHTNQASAAALGLSVLREQGVEDPLFFWAAELLRGNRPLSPANVTRAEPLHLVMIARAKGPVPEAVVQAGDPTVLAVIAATAPAEERPDRRRQVEENRIVIAERAVTAGTLEPERLRLLYRQFNVKDEPPPALAEITAATVRERAHLFQTALAQEVPAARAEVIARAIDVTRQDGGEHGPNIITAGRVYAPLIQDITPSADLVWFAGTAARALLAAGELEPGRAWLDLARTMARTSMEAGTIADGLLPIDRLLASDSTATLPPQALPAWRATVPEADRARSQDVAFNLLTAVGQPLSSADWLPVMGEPMLPVTARVTPARLWNGLELAAKDKRVGETVVFSLLTLGEAGPASVAPGAVRRVIESLMAVGREADARALAVEAALVQGL